MIIEKRETGFALILNGCEIIHHTCENPAFFIGRGEESIKMYRGNFDVQDYVIERVALTHTILRGQEIHLSTHPDHPAQLILKKEGNHLTFEATDPAINRLWIRTIAREDEHIWGGGEQMSYFDMRGRRFPLWTSEPGVGRDKTSLITFQADVSAKAGGDYYHTNYPQPLRAPLMLCLIFAIALFMKSKSGQCRSGLNFSQIPHS